jgi:hypothetical protein
VLNLVKLAGVALPSLFVKMLSDLTAQVIKDFQREFKNIIPMLSSKQVELKYQV